MKQHYQGDISIALIIFSLFAGAFTSLLVYEVFNPPQHVVPSYCPTSQPQEEVWLEQWLEQKGSQVSTTSWELVLKDGGENEADITASRWILDMREVSSVIETIEFRIDDSSATTTYEEFRQTLIREYFPGMLK